MKNHLKMRAMREHRFENIQCKTYIEAYFAFKFFWPLIKWFSEAESKSVSSVGWSLSVLMLFCRFVSIHMCKLSEEKKKFIWKRKRKERETTSSEERKKTCYIEFMSLAIVERSYVHFGIFKAHAQCTRKERSHFSTVNLFLHPFSL